MLDLFKDTDSIDSIPEIADSEVNDSDVIQRIAQLKKELSDKLLILGHHYQQDDVIQFADLTGDSLKLAEEASTIEKEYIIFCGVHFMAETADMLTGQHQKVILPDLAAGCSMADMANDQQIKDAWNFLKDCTSQKIIPITYINCTASLKSFVGEHDGSICTSSNAKKVITWAFDRGDKLLFFPDQHLGRNTSYELGIPLNEMVVYDPRRPNGGLTKTQVEKAKVILWYGFCSVHQGFTKEHINHHRSIDKERQILVHPECSFDVFLNADKAGSTSYIINEVKNAPKGSKFAIGTEINLVNRLAKQYTEKEIYSLSPYQCLCTTMYRVRPRWLLASMEAIKRGRPKNIITVDDHTKKYALVALDRMLRI